MANSNKKTPKNKHSINDYIKVYKKRFSKLDKKTKTQLITIVVLVMLIIIAAVTALSGRGKNPASSSEINGTSVVFSGSYDPFADEKYEDEYLKLIKEYSDVVIAESNTEDRNYFRETLFVGDSNTEGLAAYNHLSLQYVLGMTGMPIQQVTTNKCMWFVGYEEPVTMPVAISMLKPRRIIINFGTNNAGGTETVDFIKYYENALDSIEKAYPYTDIIVSAVLPVAKVRNYPNITMQDIDEFNLALAEMCRERDLKFLNTAEIFKDPENGFMKPEYIAKDGIHLTTEGYKALLEYVGSHKHIEPDKRPARGTIPTRRNAPYVPTESSSLASSSMAVSSSRASSSSIFSSSIVSSSKPISSSIGHSSSKIPSSSIVVSSSQVPSSSMASSSNVVSSSQQVSSISPSPETSPSEEPTATPAPSCGALGHSEVGICPVCNSEKTPEPTCGALGHSEVGTCPVCSSVKTPEPTCGSLGHSEVGTCPVCNSVKTPEPTCGDVGHSTDGTCPVCGNTYTTQTEQ